MEEDKRDSTLSSVQSCHFFPPSVGVPLLDPADRPVYGIHFFVSISLSTTPNISFSAKMEAVRFSETSEHLNTTGCINPKYYLIFFRAVLFITVSEK
jgi:hypothetical protein